MTEPQVVKVYCRRSHALAVARLIIAACAEEKASAVFLQIAGGMVEFHLPAEDGISRMSGGE